MNLKDNPARLVASAYPASIDVRTLFSDMDVFRHINNTAIGRYLEEGRADLNVRLFGAESLSAPPPGQQFLFATTTIDYLAPVNYPGSVEIRTAITRIGTSSLGSAQGVFQDGVCTGLCDSVMVKAMHGRPTPWTEAERAGMQRLMLL